jgi:hypothetical protein
VGLEKNIPLDRIQIPETFSVKPYIKVPTKMLLVMNLKQSGKKYDRLNLKRLIKWVGQFVAALVS